MLTVTFILICSTTLMFVLSGVLYLVLKHTESERTDYVKFMLSKNMAYYDDWGDLKLRYDFEAKEQD